MIPLSPTYFTDAITMINRIPKNMVFHLLTPTPHWAKDPRNEETFKSFQPFLLSPFLLLLLSV